jgi:hypothetical protein
MTSASGKAKSPIGGNLRSELYKKMRLCLESKEWEKKDSRFNLQVKFMADVPA